ncbi:hypothetical protein Lser_V15G35808 [Lactuca serriola]
MAMADWQQYTQSVVFGLVFSFLLAKLFSRIFSFGDENPRITHANPSEEQPDVIPSELHWKSAEEDKRSDAEFPKKHISSPQKESLVDQPKKIAATGSDSDDDWEGVESTELDEAFGAASAFVAAITANRSSRKVSNDLKLQLYGLYKIATEGPCNVPQPSAIKMSARVKWNAWHKLGAMPTEEAMHKYIEIITELYPTWNDGLKSKRRDGDSNEPMGPVFSTLIHEESGNELKLDAIHDFAREGDMKNLLKCVESGVSVNTKDSEGRTPLHWAVDRGHIDVVQLLLSMNADVNSKDNEGQAALHYAVVCGREEILELLVKRNGGGIKDDDLSV